MKNQLIKKMFGKKEIIDLDTLRDIAAMSTILLGMFMLYINVVAVRLAAFSA